MRYFLQRAALLALLSTTLSGSVAVYAQYGGPRLVYGFFVGTAVKAGLLQHRGARYQPWGEVNLGLSAGITGADEYAMTARLHAQLSRDDIYYRLQPQMGYIIESLSLLLNPEVSIPVRNRYGESHLDVLAGIGGDFCLDQGMTAQNVAGFFGGQYLERMDDTIRGYRRSIVPYANVGLAWKLHRRASLVLRIRQDAANLFEKESPITLYTATEARTVNLSCQATRLLIGCQIALGKLPEMY